MPFARRDQLPLLPEQQPRRPDSSQGATRKPGWAVEFFCPILLFKPTLKWAHEQIAGHDDYRQEAKSQEPEPGAEGAGPGRVRSAWRLGSEGGNDPRHQRQHRARLAQAGARARRKPAATTAFVALAIESTSLPERRIDVELRRGAVSMTMSWPLSASAEMTAWMRELLR